MVYARNVGGELVASAPEMSRGFMEVRGLGIVNITTLCGRKVPYVAVPLFLHAWAHIDVYKRQQPGQFFTQADDVVVAFRPVLEQIQFIQQVLQAFFVVHGSEIG